ncbi:hypothetical protein NDU88_005925 [Pleurodeles waltl]|uniref:Uncharacterized protein n=1 Tax=Pleurodeles waltl TaxID=8319 RepID=A0AAV7W9C5_PLEWA|nr:hypothetical protein NDU88_005925 [Pleurodeles waltl]
MLGLDIADGSTWSRRQCRSAAGAAAHVAQITARKSGSDLLDGAVHGGPGAPLPPAFPCQEKAGGTRVLYP